mgnify:CR=1|jgi:hypothetical protein|tara:strand:- start:3632 stop:3859 length:228 start_codon:yes stop_codon:yes gene_type:complete
MSSLERSQQFWKIYIKAKPIIRNIYECSSFLVFLMSFEQAYKLKTLSVVKPWQIARLAEKSPKLLKAISKVAKVL